MVKYLLFYLESQLHDSIRTDFVFLAKFFAVVVHLQHVKAQGFGDGHVIFLGFRNAVFDAVVQLKVFNKKFNYSGKPKKIKCNYCTKFPNVAGSIKTRWFGVRVNLGLVCAVLEHVGEISQNSDAIAPGMLKVDASRAVFGENQRERLVKPP
jgi:hypothetical protein